MNGMVKGDRRRKQINSTKREKTQLIPVKERRAGMSETAQLGYSLLAFFSEASFFF